MDCWYCHDGADHSSLVQYAFSCLHCFGLYFDDKLDDGKIVATVLVTGISSTDIDLPSNQAINRLNPANN